MANLKLTIAYDGTNFLGWQKTEMGRSVEGALEEALNLITQQPIHLQAASRTDAGVHALGQVVNVALLNLRYTAERLKVSLNQLLPKDVVVLSIEEVEEAFHATLDAKEKEYHYLIDTRPEQLPLRRFIAWHCPYTLDLSRMLEAKEALVGTHDFSSFCNVRKNEPIEEFVRTLYSISIEEGEGSFLIKMHGNRFLYRMARNIAGTLVDVGRGIIESSSISSILAAKERSLAGVTAPSHGLTLYRVKY